MEFVLHHETLPFFRCSKVFRAKASSTNLLSLAMQTICVCVLGNVRVQSILAQRVTYIKVLSSGCCQANHWTPIFHPI